jgi:hypothetical protein
MDSEGHGLGGNRLAVRHTRELVKLWGNKKAVRLGANRTAVNDNGREVRRKIRGSVVDANNDTINKACTANQ